MNKLSKKQPSDKYEQALAEVERFAIAHQKLAQEIGLGPDDSGELTMAIVADPDSGKVHINFGIAVSTVGLSVSEALDMARKLKRQARLATKK